MKILIVSFTFPPESNGVSHVAYAHARGFISKGHKVTVITAINPERNIHQLMREGIEVFQVNVKGSGNLRVGYSGEIKKYQELLTTLDADIMLFHCWQGWAADLAIPVFPYIKAKKVLISHGVSANSIFSLRNVITWLCWRPYVWRMPRMMKKFDHIVFLCDRKDKDRFYDFYLANKIGFKNYSIIPNGTYEIDHKTLPNFREKFRIGSRKMVLSVSNFEPRKNQKMSLRAFYRAKINDSILVYIGSQKNNYSAELQNLAKKMGIEEKVLILSGLSKEDISAAYLSADLFVLSSLSEAQPLVILESMRAGVPFISTDVGCVSDLPGGLTVKNVSEMAEKIKLLLTDEDLRRRLGQEGKEACKKVYSWDIVIEKYEALFRGLLEST